MTARPGGHLGGGGRIRALVVAVWAALALVSAALALPATPDTTGLARLRERPLPLVSASVRALALADDPEDDPASEAVPVHSPSSPAPAELLPNLIAQEPLAPPAAALAPRGPPSDSR